MLTNSLPRTAAFAGAVAGGVAIGVLCVWSWEHFLTAGDAIALPTMCLALDDRPSEPGVAGSMVWIPPGRFKMGSEQFRREEAPVHEAAVAGFWIDNHDVTNAEFRRFVEATGYVTLAERANASPQDAAPGAFVFIRPGEVRDLSDIGQWWKFIAGANWRHPEGPTSDLTGRDHHPVVDVAYADAEAYARWAGRRLPGEAEWEYAARGGLDGAAYVWGEAPASTGAPRANYWHGIFPILNRNVGGYIGTTPVGCYPANGYGLYDMAGNVWQWTRDRWNGEAAFDGAPGRGAAPADLRVIKGGSFLCADNFCLRYRPAARQPGDAAVGASHIGFRTAWDGPPPG
jgi:formylglycine-generating enzyme